MLSLSFVQFGEFNIVFMFRPAILACAVNRPVSTLASFIVFLIHLGIVSLDTGLNVLVVVIKSAKSDDLVNLISRNSLNKFGHKSGHSGHALNIKNFWQYLGLECFNTSSNTFCVSYIHVSNLKISQCVYSCPKNIQKKFLFFFHITVSIHILLLM